MQYESSFNYECGTKHERYVIQCRENIFSGRTTFQNVNIYDTYFYGKILVLDGLIQSSQLDEHRYHEALVQPAMTVHHDPKNVLIIGGGEGATAREVLKHPNVQRCVMVDIDGELVEQCKEHLPEWHQGAFADPRLELVIGDGLKFVAESREMFDVIIIDVCDSFENSSPTEGFFCPTFFRQLKRILELQGIVVYQAMCASMRENEDFAGVFNGLNDVFTYTSPYTTYVQSFWSEWGFVIASDVHHVASLPANWIERTLEQRKLQDKLRFFDMVTFRNMFSVPRDIREALYGSQRDLDKRILRVTNPVAASAGALA